MGWKKQDGTAALETALVMPAVALLLMLFLDLGVFFFDYVSANNAVREGARCGAVGHDDVSVDVRVRDTSGFGDPVTVVTDRTSGQIGDDIIVTATYAHDWILSATVFGVPDQFSVSATMRLESSGQIAGSCGG